MSSDNHSSVSEPAWNTRRRLLVVYSSGIYTTRIVDEVGVHHGNSWIIRADLGQLLQELFDGPPKAYAPDERRPPSVLDEASVKEAWAYRREKGQALDEHTIVLKTKTDGIVELHGQQHSTAYAAKMQECLVKLEVERDQYRSQIAGRDTRIRELEEQLKLSRELRAESDKSKQRWKAEHESITVANRMLIEQNTGLRGSRDAWRTVATTLFNILRNKEAE